MSQSHPSVDPEPTREWQRRPAAVPPSEPAPAPEWQHPPAAVPPSEPAPAQIGYFDPEAPIECLTGDLPHWRQQGVTYFITFRQADSIPHEKLQQWYHERQLWLTAHPPPHDLATRLDYHLRFPQRLQDWLDAGYGSCILALLTPKRIVEDALAHFDGTRYALDRKTVAANHVHVIVTPLHGFTLSSIYHSWKSFTSHEIVKVLRRDSAKVATASRRGSPPRPASPQRRDNPATFWQKESFDHIIRSPASLEKFRHYIDAHNRDPQS